MRERIIECSIELFGKSGIKGLTMDSVAGELGISKRTLYEHFNGKEELLRACLQFRLNRCKLLVQTNNGLIDELVELYVGIKQVNLLNAHRFCMELQKFYDPLYRILLQQLLDYASICGEKVPQGITDGYLRRGVFPSVVCISIAGYLTRLFTCVGPDYRDIEKVLSPETIILFTRGLCTIKGRDYLDQKLKEIL